MLVVAQMAFSPSERGFVGRLALAVGWRVVWGPGGGLVSRA